MEVAAEQQRLLMQKMEQQDMLLDMQNGRDPAESQEVQRVTTEWQQTIRDLEQERQNARELQQKVEELGGRLRAIEKEKQREDEEPPPGFWKPQDRPDFGYDATALAQQLAAAQQTILNLEKRIEDLQEDPGEGEKHHGEGEKHHEDTQMNDYFRSKIVDMEKRARERIEDREQDCATKLEDLKEKMVRAHRAASPGQQRMGARPSGSGSHSSAKRPNTSQPWKVSAPKLGKEKGKGDDSPSGRNCKNS
mmetsp:Transcript_135472/g.235020  ORF Transcript_135472/g.235020 Transcript_135472/m.235020 type:complete len:249 (-) Transcript_135472:2344-3090(-)